MPASLNLQSLYTGFFDSCSVVAWWTNAPISFVMRGLRVRLPRLALTFPAFPCVFDGHRGPLLGAGVTRSVTRMGQRKSLPKSVRERILNEWNHKCAICGKERPQIHHIDGNHDN